MSFAVQPFHTGSFQYTWIRNKIINGKHEGHRWEIKTNNKWRWCENKVSMAFLTLVNNTTWGGSIGNTLLFVKQTWMAALKCRKSSSCQATLPDIFLSYEIPPLTWQCDMNGMSHQSAVILMCVSILVADTKAGDNEIRDKLGMHWHCCFLSRVYTPVLGFMVLHNFL